MDRNTFTSSFKRNIINRGPKAFILFLALVVITECAIFYFSPYIAGNSVNIRTEAVKRVSQIEGIDRDILILGDSSAGVGINPQRLHKDTGLTCANLAIQGRTTVAANYFLLQDYLKSNNAPKLIVFMRTFNGWSSDLKDINIVDLLLDNFPVEMGQTFANTRLIGANYKLLLQEMPGYLLPSQRNRWAIRRAVWKVIGMKKTIPEVLIESRQEMHEWEQRILGEIPYDIGGKGTAEKRERNLSSNMEFVRENEFHASEWSTYYLEQFMTLAKQNGTTIFVCLSPVRQEIYEDEAGRRYLNSSKAFINDVVDSHDNVVLLTDDFHFVTADQIRDSGTHINAEESIIFTDMIAQRLLEYQDN